jgi:hypothetical protein
MATFPGGTVTKPSGIATSQLITVVHVDTAWDEIIALQNVLRGATLPTTTQIKLAGGAIGVVPLTLQGFSGQTADLFNVGSSAAVNDRLQVSAAGKLTLPVATVSGGVSLGTGSNVWTTGTNLRLKPQTDATAAVEVRNAADAGTSVVVDTTNARVQVGSSTVPPATLSLDTGTARTTAAFGIQFSTDVNLYRSAADTLKTDDSFIVGVGLTATTVTIGVMALNTSVGGTYTGTGQVTALAKDFEVRKSDGQSRLILSRPDGVRRAIRLDNDDQVIVEVA